MTEPKKTKREQIKNNIKQKLIKQKNNKKNEKQKNNDFVFFELCSVIFPAMVTFFVSRQVVEQFMHHLR